MNVKLNNIIYKNIIYDFIEDENYILLKLDLIILNINIKDGIEIDGILNDIRGYITNVDHIIIYINKSKYKN